MQDKFDAVDWTVPGPGLYEVPYEVALHLRARSVVPGSRNPGTGKQLSQIGIVRTSWGDPIDPPAACEPFTEDQVSDFWSHVEAIDRASMLLPSQRNVQTVATRDVSARVATAEMSQSLAERAALLKEVPVEENEALAEMLEAGAVAPRRAGRR